jgi:hypothetical protein
MELQSIGLGGLEKAQERLAAVAKRISGGAQATLAAGGDSVDLSAEMVALMEVKNLANVNLKLVETANELAASTIDVLG